MKHYHFIFEAHNEYIPTGGLIEPTTLDFIMDTPDVDQAVEKAKGWVKKQHYQLEKIFEHDPDLEQQTVSVNNAHTFVSPN